MKKVLKRSLSFLLAITIILSSAYVGLAEIDSSGLFVVEAKAADYSDIYSDELVYLDDVTAKRFIAFIYNVTTDKVTDEMKSLDDVFNYLTGRLTKGTDEYINAQTSFLLTTENFVNRHLDEADRICTLSSSHLVDMLSEKAGTIEAISDELADEVLDEVKSSIEKVLYYVDEFNESPVMNNIGLALSGYINVTGAISKARDFVDSLEMIVTTSFAMSSTNAKKAYTYYSTYLNNRQFGEDTVELLLDALLLQIDIFDGLVTIFESLGFENSWTNDEVQRLVRTFAEFTYHSKVEFEERYYEKPSTGSGSTVSVSGVYFTIGSMGLAMNQKATIPARYKPLSATVGTSITYTSSNTSVMTVNNSGLVTPVSAGTANLIATSSNGCQAVCKITVYPYDVAANGNGYTISNYVGSGGSVVIPSKIDDVAVTEIGAKTFYNRRNITTVTIPDGITIIGEDAFYNCLGLTSITFPNTMTKVASGAFGYCSNLNAVHITDLAAWCSIDFESYPLAHAKNLYVNGILATDIVIPDGVKNIGGGVFYGCTSITSVTFPNSVKTIGSNAFWGCTKLNAVYITDIASWCNIEFENGGSNPLRSRVDLYINGELAKDVVIPNGITHIPVYGFSCSSIRTIEIPNSVKSIGDNAFYGCTTLTSIVMPGSVTSIGNSAFYECSSLSYIEIPYGVKSIGHNAFSWCSGLKSIEIPNSVISMGNSVFDGCVELETVLIGNGVQSIGDCSFWDCTNLTSITIPNSVKSIGDSAFYNCAGLTSVTIPDSVTSIGDAAFSYCTSLSSITIPESVVAIGEYAFDCCEQLVSVKLSDNMPQIPRGIFYDCTNLKSVGWGESITSIDKEAFVNCTNLTSITIPKSVTSIGDSAFDGCSNLETVHITDIDSWCEIDFGDRLSNPMCYADNLCLNDELVAEVIIPDNIAEIKSYSFYGCENIKSITIPDTVTSIGEDAFSKCDSLILYFNENSTAHSYAENNNISYMLFSEETKLDLTSEFICTDISGRDLESIIPSSEDITYKTNTNLAGTGTVVDVIKNGVLHSQYTLVVKNDTNGDGVCDALDAWQVGLVSNGHETLDGAYAMAADSNYDEVVDITDYQSVVNKAVS